MDNEEDIKRIYRNIFNSRDVENQKFWTRLGGIPDFSGSTVLEVGCGVGGLSVDIALSGAKKVIGLDIDETIIDFARENVRVHYPELQQKIAFECVDLLDYKSNLMYDYIVSKNSFEHILYLEELLNEMKKRLKTGGKLFTGFGPLYRSMNGAHMERFLIPWGHLILPEWLYLKISSLDRGHPVRSMDDFALNRLRFRDYIRIFKNSGLSIVYFKENQSDNFVVKLFYLISRIPFLKEYFTTNIYCIFKKKSDG